MAGASITLIACAMAVMLISRASTKTPEHGPQDLSQSEKASSYRNLSLKPEALSVGRQLGDRFKPASRAVTTAVGTLIRSGNEEPIVVVRRQTENGEIVDIQLENRNLRWNGREPLSASSGVPADVERLLAERLILDSPDQFVLAQLRGAAYFTVARNVRPTDAADNYTGPLWNLVRVDEPQQQDENLRALSTWRIYYINVQTGLPDRIEYQLNGKDIQAEFVDWTEQNGEKTPARVTWSSGGKIIMEYTARTVSHNQ